MTIIRHRFFDDPFGQMHIRVATPEKQARFESQFQPMLLDEAGIRFLQM